MKVMVTGSTGMLGGHLLHALAEAGHDVSGSGGHATDIAEAADIHAALKAFRPEVVINAAGSHAAYGKLPPESWRMVKTNALGPWTLTEMCGRFSVHLIHVSTDCVFGVGDPLAPRLPHRFDGETAPTDLYGRSKLAGEPVGEQRVTIVRTSFVGPQHGLWRWLVEREQGSEVDGWARAYWSGSTAVEVARRLAEMCADPPGGIVHLATEEPTSKYDVLQVLADRLRSDLKVWRVDEPQIGRALAPNYEPLVPFTEALDLALDHYRERGLL